MRINVALNMKTRSRMKEYSWTATEISAEIHEKGLQVSNENPSLH